MSTNPFRDLPGIIHPVIERLLRDIYQSGEWTDEHEDLLADWRNAQGENGMTGWRWWTGEVHGESYALDFSSRDEAIEGGRRLIFQREIDGPAFWIIEARCWADCVKEGEDIMPFAETRNKETIDG